MGKFPLPARKATRQQQDRMAAGRAEPETGIDRTPCANTCTVLRADRRLCARRRLT